MIDKEIARETAPPGKALVWLMMFNSDLSRLLMVLDDVARSTVNGAQRSKRYSPGGSARCRGCNTVRRVFTCSQGVLSTTRVAI